MNPIVSEHARAARILVAISFHFDAGRLGFLAEVLRSLAEFPVAALHVAILTNTAQEEELSPLCRLCAESLPGKTFSVRSHRDLAHPFDLTWSHKTIIVEEFIAGSPPCYTHFIYLEDDIRLSFANFSYFVYFRERLRAFGLLPAFVRMEYSAARGGLVASDAFWPVYVPVQIHVRFGNIAMVNMPNPYNPGFILDVELAKEYVVSRSFDRVASAEVCPWGVRERAAMGLCLENVPPPFHTRYVVPVSTQTDLVLATARISHLPNNYADDPRTPLGKVRIDSLFRGAGSLMNGDWWPLSAAGATPTLAQSGETKSLDRYYLVTHHDTILFLDEGAQRFHHGPFGIAPLNLILEVDGKRGHLVLSGDAQTNDRKVSFATPDGETRFLSESFDPDLEIEWLTDGSIGLRINELYVAAEFEGIVRNNRTWCRAYEQFRLIRTDTIDGFAILQRNSWLCHSNGQTVNLAPQPIDFGRERPHESSALAATCAPGTIESRRDIVFGPARLRLVGQAPQIVFNRASDADPTASLDVFINDITETRYGFSRLTSNERDAGQPEGCSSRRPDDLICQEAMSLDAELIERMNWSPVHGATVRVDDRGLLVVGDGASLDYHLLRWTDRRANGARVKLRMVAKPADRCDTNLYVHHWGPQDICSIAKDGTVVLNEGTEKLEVEHRQDGFLEVNAVFQNHHDTLSIGMGKPNGYYHGTGTDQYIFKSIDVELLPLNPIRQILVDRLWRGNDPFRGFPGNLFEYDLQGWNSQHAYLSDAIAELRPSVIVEVGVWKGGSTVFMANAAKTLGLATVVIAIDTWLGSSEHWLQQPLFSEMSFLSGYPALYHKFLSNVIRAGVADYVMPIPIDSLNAAHILKSVGVAPELIHLDGGHDYDSVMADLRVWWPLLAPGGVLIGDDYFETGMWPSVRQAFDEFFGALDLLPIENLNGKCRLRKPRLARPRNRSDEQA